MDDIKINFFEGLGILFLNVIVICLEVIIFISSLIQSYRLVELVFVYGFYSFMINEFFVNLFLSYNMKDGYLEFSFDIGKMFLDYRDNYGNY